jgi:hypothetical protein
MTKKELLQNAIWTISRRAGIDAPHPFHVTQISQDPDGVYLMQVTWPEGKRVCEEVRRTVASFPVITYSSCVPLLPEVVDEIIMVAGPEPYSRGQRGHD